MNLVQLVYALSGVPVDDQTLATLDEVRIRWKVYLQDLEPFFDEMTGLCTFKQDFPKMIYTLNPQLMHAIGQRGRSEILYASTVQFFWKDRKLYAISSFGDEAKQRFVFPELPGPMVTFRWDISAKPAHLMVQKVWIEDNNGQVRGMCSSCEDLGQGCSELRKQLRSAVSDLSIASIERGSLCSSAAIDSASMQELDIKLKGCTRGSKKQRRKCICSGSCGWLKNSIWKYKHRIHIGSGV